MISTQQRYMMARRKRVTDPYRYLLGPSLVGLWDARVGVSLIGGAVDSWTDQISGITLRAPDAGTRPTYQADGTNWKKRPVVGCVRTINSRLGAVGIPIQLQAGSRSEMFVVGRFQSLDSGPQWIMASYDYPSTANLAGILMQNGNQITAELSGGNIGAYVSNVEPSLFEIYRQPSDGAAFLAINGLSLVSGLPGGSNSVSSGQIWIGGQSVANYTPNCVVAMAGLINTTPDAATRAQLWSLVKQDWGVPETFADVLGSSMILEFDARFHSIAGTWVDRRKGMRITRYSTVTPYTPDPGYFSGLPVHQCDAATTAMLANESLILPNPPVWLAGAKPYLLSVMRPRAVPGAGGAGWAARVLSQDQSMNTVGVIGTNYTVPQVAVAINDVGGITIDFSDLGVHVWEAFLDAANNTVLALDGVPIGTASNVPLKVNSGLITFGGNHTGTAITNTSHALHIFCDHVPSASERARVLELAQRIWNIPPLNPSTILGPLLHSDFDAADPDIVLNGGNVASIPSRGTDAAAMVQVTSAKQPAWSATSFSGRPGITFDGMATTLGCVFASAIPSGRRPYLWVVFKMLDTIAVDQGAASIWNGGQLGFCIVYGSSATSQLSGLVRSTSAAWSVVPVKPADLQPHLAEAGIVTGGIGAVVVDGVAYNASPSNGAVTQYSWDVSTMGSAFGGQQFAHCTVARVIIANNEPTQTQRNLVRAYLRMQYGI